MSALCHQYSKAERCHHTCFLHEKATSGRLIADFPTRSRMRAYSSAPVPSACRDTCMHACTDTR